MDTLKTVLITGCSSGIGYELMKLFDREPYRIAATALPDSIDQLRNDQATSSARIRLFELDVCDYARSIEIVNAISEQWGPVDILINNAGISYRSTIEDMTAEDEQHQMQVNYLGPMHLVRQCLPGMRERRSGRIINISSVGGMMAMPTMASYSASKFALEGATEALWYEMKPWNVKITLVRPGFINSLAFRKVLSSKQRVERKNRPSPYDAYYRNMTAFIEKLMTNAPSNSAAVARRIFRVVNMKNPPLRFPGTPDAWLFHYIRRLLPRSLYHIFLFRFLPGIKKWGND